MNRVPGSHGSRSFLIYVSANTQVSHHQLLMINVVYLLKFFRVAWLVQVIAKWSSTSSSTNGIFRLSVRLSVTPLSLCSHHHIFIKFSGVITNDKSEVHAKGQGHRSKVKVTEVKMQLKRFWTVTHTAWSCFEEVPYCFSRSSIKFQGHKAKKIVGFDPDWAFPDCNSSLNSPMVTKWCTKLEVA